MVIFKKKLQFLKNNLTKWNVERRQGNEVTKMKLKEDIIVIVEHMSQAVVLDEEIKKFEFNV